MNHFLITVAPRKSQKLQEKKYQIFLPDWIKMIQVRFYTPYKTEVLNAEYTAYKKFDDWQLVSSMEELIEELQKIKFYEWRDVYKDVEEVIEVRPFKLSACFIISEIQFRKNCYSYVNGMTFFKVVKSEPPVKDIEFNDKDLMKSLDCGLAKSGSYFLHGSWKFFRSKSAPVNWEARFIVKKKVRVDRKYIELEK